MEMGGNWSNSEAHTHCDNTHCPGTRDSADTDSITCGLQEPGEGSDFAIGT